MTIRTAFLTLSLLALPVSTVIACDAPSAPIVPDGDSASLGGNGCCSGRDQDLPSI
jgi:hypothetical protein